MLRTKLLIVLFMALLAGCAQQGPSSIARDRFDYVSAISDSWKRQMLLNLLKMRYSDAPVFMDIASVVSSYELSGELNLRGQVADKFHNSLTGDQFLSLGATGRYVDRPTISYQPLAGDKFTKSMMTPVPVSSILFLIQAGYPADLVFRICVNSINGIDNSYGGPGNPRSGDRKFHELITVIRQSQALGGLSLRLKVQKDRQPVVMTFRPISNDSVTIPNQTIRTLLNLDPNASEYTISFGDYPENNREISILSRSITQILIDFASYIDVPPGDVAEGRVHVVSRTPEQEQLFPPLVVIRSGTMQPDDAFVSVQYRSNWFWIEDRDKESKMMFTFLMMLFSLTETTSTQAAPILTVPTR